VVDPSMDSSWFQEVILISLLEFFPSIYVLGSLIFLDKRFRLFLLQLNVTVTSHTSDGCRPLLTNLL
jgi:hypothetical protein